MSITSNEVKQKLIEGLNLEELIPDDIDDNAPLFNDGLGLDSVDAIELIVVLDANYNVKFENMDELKDIFSNITSLTAYINKNTKN